MASLLWILEETPSWDGDLVSLISEDEGTALGSLVSVEMDVVSSAEGTPFGFGDTTDTTDGSFWDEKAVRGVWWQGGRFAGALFASLVFRAGPGVGTERGGWFFVSHGYGQYYI